MNAGPILGRGADSGQSLGVTGVSARSAHAEHLPTISSVCSLVREELKRFIQSLEIRGCPGLARPGLAFPGFSLCCLVDSPAMENRKKGTGAYGPAAVSLASLRM